MLEDMHQRVKLLFLYISNIHVPLFPVLIHLTRSVPGTMISIKSCTFLLQCNINWLNKVFAKKHHCSLFLYKGNNHQLSLGNNVTELKQNTKAKICSWILMGFGMNSLFIAVAMLHLFQVMTLIFTISDFCCWKEPAVKWFVFILQSDS